MFLELVMTSVLQTQCMTEALFFEARNQPLKGQEAVATTIMNRVKSKRFPDTVCEVVNQPYQFSYTLKPQETLSETLRTVNKLDRLALAEAFGVATRALSDNLKNTHTSLHYYNPAKANPSWARKFDNTFTIADHKWVY